MSKHNTMKQETETGLTICAKCDHFVTKGTNSIWYNLYCGHPDNRRKEVVDTVTGEKGFAVSNDLGRSSISDEAMPHAREINNGMCPQYKEAK